MRLSRALALALLVTAACSGATTTDLLSASGGSASDGGGVDAGKDGTTGNEGGVVPPPPPPGTDGGPPPTDSGIVVTEKPAPICHDLTQHDAFVVATANPAAPPPANPLSTLTPGLYVASAVIEWQSNTTLEPAQQITADITASRYYYRYDTATDHLAITTDWAVDRGTLTRNILCTSGNPGGGPVKQRIDVSANGYTIWTTSRQGNPLSIKYVHSN